MFTPTFLVDELAPTSRLSVPLMHDSFQFILLQWKQNKTKKTVKLARYITTNATSKMSIMHTSCLGFEMKLRYAQSNEIWN